ncbi:MAG: NFACT RNA binding domain-containing protein [archaeon]
MPLKIVLDVSKSAQENAQSFFSDAKKWRAKAEGTKEGMARVREKLEEMRARAEETKAKAPEKVRKKEWFEKFRWCLTRNGLLVIGGRDAHSNEVIVKRHLDEKDAYFHADVFGAPHCVLKIGDQKATPLDLEDAAAFAGVFSSVWKKGVLSVKVFQAKKSQVTKQAPTGESVGRGAFMIYGKRDWFEPRLSLGWGVQRVGEGYRALCGPLSCVKAHAEHVIEIIPGKKSKSDMAKAYSSFLKKRKEPILISLDELVAALPTGEFSSKTS